MIFYDRSTLVLENATKPLHFIGTLINVQLWKNIPLKKISSTLLLSWLSLTFSLLLLLSCKPSVPHLSESDISSWFVNPSKEVHQGIVRLNPDTLQSILHKKRIYGTVHSQKGHTTLVDTNGTTFISGFQTPAYINSDSLYPLIIYLHGGTGTEVNTKGERAFEMLSPMADSTPLFLISPSASRHARWWTPVGLSRILQSLRFMTLTYPIDPSKVFLAGVSDGATGCFAAANAIPLPFAGFFIISGYGGLLPSAGMPIIPQNIKQRPIYNVHASEDRLYPLEMVNKFLDYLENNGVRIERKVYNGEQHGFDYRVKEFPVLISLIKRWKREMYKGNSWHFIKDYPNTPANCINWIFQPNAEKSFFSAYPSGDTLIVYLEGLKQIILFQPNQYKKRVIKIGNSRQVYTLTGKPNQQTFNLHYMKYTCFPKTIPGIFTKIVP